MIKLPTLPPGTETIENLNFGDKPLPKSTNKFLPAISLVIGIILFLNGFRLFMHPNPSPVAGLFLIIVSGFLGFYCFKSGVFKLSNIGENYKLSSDMVELQLASDMSDQQKQAFMFELASNRKKKSTAYLFNIFLGGVGAHHFYLGNKSRGILYICLLVLWIVVPILAIIDLFLMDGYVEEANKRMATSTAQKIKLMFPSYESK